VETNLSSSGSTRSNSPDSQQQQLWMVDNWYGLSAIYLFFSFSYKKNIIRGFYSRLS
jgi:hypothetical protein